MSLLFSFLISMATGQDTSNLFYNAQIEVTSVDSGWSFYGCDTEDIEIFGEDPVTHLQRKVSLTFYKASDEKSQRAVILLPPTGGVNILDRGYANKLCDAGISVALIAGWEHQQDSTLDFSMHDFGALRFLSATRHAAEFLSAKKIKSIGLLGTSIGAIGGALAFGVDERISAASFIVGSARFADVIAYSNEQGATQLRNARMKAFGIKTVQEYRDILRQNVKIEPMNYFKNNGKKQALIVTANRDETVPTEYQYELAELLGARHIQLEGNHLEVIKSTFWGHADEIIQFFDENLAK